MSSVPITVVSRFKGYRTKSDETNMESNGYLVSGSKNVVSTDGDSVAVRKGYTLFGGAASGSTGITSSYEWKTHRGTELMLRKVGTVLEAYDDNVSDFVTVLAGVSSGPMNFTEYWDETEGQDALLFVDGSSSINYWSGAKTTFASATTNTITKQGTETWAELGFLASGTRRVRFGGSEYEYSGGESTTTLTGVTPDPTVTPIAAGTTIWQSVRTTDNSAMTSLPSSFENSLITTTDNQVWIGSLSSREIYKSKAGDYTDYSFSAPRLVGEGLILTLDGTPTAFAPQEDSLWISAGKDYWYTTVISLSDDLQNETISVERLKTSPGQSAVDQGSVGFIKNVTVFVSNDATVDSLGRVENVDTPQSRTISDPIKPDMDSYDLASAHLKYFRNYLYVALPEESLLLAYNVEKGFWEAPWTMPAGRLAVYGGSLYMHSNSSDETYLMLDGYNDNGNPIGARARFDYLNGGMRASRKTHTEWYSEGYASTNADIGVSLSIDWNGSMGTITKSISGSADLPTTFASNESWSLGKTKLGATKLGGFSERDGVNKFRVIHEMPPEKWYEIQPEYSSDNIDAYWEILAYGCDMSKADDENGDIRQ